MDEARTKIVDERKVKLQIKDLTKNYAGKAVLDKVNFEIMEGEFISILGPSGCGKTTILKILIGILADYSGEILLHGKEISTIAPSKRGMGIVFQNYALFQNMTVLQNIKYALKFDKEKKANALEIAEKLSEQMGISEHNHKKIHKLSGGQQQRVAIARTLAMNPNIILLDEPLSALDVETRLSLREEFKRIQKTLHTTMIYITHDQEEAFAMSDRIVVMEVGKIVQIDTPEQIIENPANQYVEDFVIKNLKIKINSLKKYVREDR